MVNLAGIPTDRTTILTNSAVNSSHFPRLELCRRLWCLGGVEFVCIMHFIVGLGSVTPKVENHVPIL